jgi:predicted RNase H-like HicB family nuclease
VFFRVHPKGGPVGLGQEPDGLIYPPEDAISMKWHLVVERDEESGRYLGTVPGLSIYVEGETVEEARRALREAIPLHLQALRDRGAQLPPPPLVEAVEVG